MRKSSFFSFVSENSKMAEAALTCNVINCSKKLCNEAVITSCSHIFCKDHGSSLFKNAKSNCLVCGSNLFDQVDVCIKNMNPNDKYKSMMLSGLHPDQIIDIAGRGISFYTYQQNIKMERKDNYLKNVRRHQDEEKITLSASFQAEILKLQRLAESLRTELEEKRNAIEGHKDKISQLVRENKHIQSKLEACRREMIFQRTPPVTPPIMSTPSRYNNYMQLDNAFSDRQSRSSNGHLF